MKKIPLLVIVAAVVAMIGIAQNASAQNKSPYWSLQGNSNSTTLRKLGTTNAIPLNLYTNNKIRLHIETSGSVSIGNGGTSDPNYKFYVKGSNYGIRGTGNVTGVYGESTNGYGIYGNSTSGYGIYGNSTDGYGGVFTSTNGPAGYFSSTNSTGLDAYTTNGSYGVYAYNSNGVYGVYGYSPSYYGVYGFGGSIGLYGSGGSYGTYGIGDSYGAAGYSSGSVGVYGESPDGVGGYFHSTNFWGLEASTDNGTYAGVFFGDVYSSTQFVTSDRKLKNKIEDFGNAMSIINKLKPKFYEFKDEAQYTSLHLPKGTHYGLVAQDVEQVLPNLVKDSKFELIKPADPLILKPKSPDGKDVNVYQKNTSAVQKESIGVKAVNYQELIPIMIKAMQEQNAKIDALTNQLNALLGSKQSDASNTNASTAVKLFNTHLGQSTPNPATSSTSIQYSNVPNGAHAQLLISDANGKMMKQIQLSNSGGTVNVDVSSLSAGIYKYSLIVNGNLVETKTMQISK